MILVDDTTDHRLLEEVLKGPATVTIGVSDDDADEVVAACLGAAVGTRVVSECRLLESDSDPG